MTWRSGIVVGRDAQVRSRTRRDVDAWGKMATWLRKARSDVRAVELKIYYHKCVRRMLLNVEHVDCVCKYTNLHLNLGQAGKNDNTKLTYPHTNTTYYIKIPSLIAICRRLC